MPRAKSEHVLAALALRSLGGIGSPEVSIRARWFAVTAALLVMAGLGAASASAATPSCGNTCVDFSSQLYGSASSPPFVLADAPNLQNVGQPLTLASASNFNPGEDFLMSAQGLVSDFVAAGLMAPQMGTLYGSLDVYEIEYAPFGAATGLCVGVPATPGSGTRVQLEPCGVSCKTCWIIDTSAPTPGPDLPLIQGATNSNFPDPPVLTAPLPGQPLTTSLLRVAGNAALPKNQLWGTKSGVL